MSDEMEDGEEAAENAEEIARIASEFAGALSPGSVVVKLQNGREIVGTLAGFGARKKEGRKGGVSWSGSIKVQTDTGILQVDCLNVASITAK